MVKRPPTKAKGRVPAWQLPKTPHQFELISADDPELMQRCVYCFKQKPAGYNNYNECPRKPDLFLHFKEDVSLIMREGRN